MNGGTVAPRWHRPRRCSGGSTHRDLVPMAGSFHVVGSPLFADLT